MTASSRSTAHRVQCSIFFYMDCAMSLSLRKVTRLRHDPRNLDVRHCRTGNFLPSRVEWEAPRAMYSPCALSKKASKFIARKCPGTTPRNCSSVNSLRTLLSFIGRRTSKLKCAPVLVIRKKPCCGSKRSSWRIQLAILRHLGLLQDVKVSEL